MVAQISSQPSVIAENSTGFDISSPASCGDCTLRVTSDSTNNIISIVVTERGSTLYSEGDVLEVTKRNCELVLEIIQLIKNWS